MAKSGLLLSRTESGTLRSVPDEGVRLLAPPLSSLPRGDTLLTPYGNRSKLFPRSEVTLAVLTANGGNDNAYLILAAFVGGAAGEVAPLSEIGLIDEDELIDGTGDSAGKRVDECELRVTADEIAGASRGTPRAGYAPTRRNLPVDCTLLGMSDADLAGDATEGIIVVSGR